MRLFDSVLYIGLAALLLVFLTARAGALRGKYNVYWGDGGHDDLRRALRAHGNCMEQIPIALLVILSVDLVGHEKWIVHVLGIALLVSRVIHVHTLLSHEQPTIQRAIGIGVTALVIIVGAILAILGWAGIRL